MTSSQHTQRHLSPVTRWALLISGLVAVALAVIGIFLPLLPTVPFLLLAAACFTRSSERFYSWLIEHAHLGPLVRPYLEGKGLKQSTKRKAIGLVWFSIAFSVYHLDGRYWVQGTLVMIALGVTIYLCRLPELGADDS
jgi:uncharacterized membrane protein YbaN (DUF454 family)